MDRSLYFTNDTNEIITITSPFITTLSPKKNLKMLKTWTDFILIYKIGNNNNITRAVDKFTNDIHFKNNDVYFFTMNY